MVHVLDHAQNLKAATSMSLVQRLSCNHAHCVNYARLGTEACAGSHPANSWSGDPSFSIAASRPDARGGVMAAARSRNCRTKMIVASVRRRFPLASWGCLIQQTLWKTRTKLQVSRCVQVANLHKKSKIGSRKH